MRNGTKVSLLLAATIAAWFVRNAIYSVLHGPHTYYLCEEDALMCAFWLFALSRAYLIGKGASPFPRLKAWLDKTPGLTDEEYAAAVAAKMAAAAAAAEPQEQEPSKTEEPAEEKQEPAPKAEPAEEPHPTEELFEDELHPSGETEEEDEEEQEEPDNSLDDLM